MEKFTIDFLKSIGNEDLIYWTYQTYQNEKHYPKNKQLLDFINKHSKSLHFIEYSNNSTENDISHIVNKLKNIIIISHSDASIEKNTSSSDYKYKSLTREESSGGWIRDQFNIPEEVYRIYNKCSFITDDPKII